MANTVLFIFQVYLFGNKTIFFLNFYYGIA